VWIAFRGEVARDQGLVDRVNLMPTIIEVWLQEAASTSAAGRRDKIKPGSLTPSGHFANSRYFRPVRRKEIRARRWDREMLWGRRRGDGTIVAVAN
jgi:hypothetical protein